MLEDLENACVYGKEKRQLCVIFVVLSTGMENVCGIVKKDNFM